MEEAVNRLARELIDAVASAVSRDPRVEACRQRARASGYDMRVTLDAIVSITDRMPGRATSEAAQPDSDAGPDEPFEISASDRRFLKSLRIAAGETPEEVE